MFTCVSCGQSKSDNESVFVDKDWCLDCYNDPTKNGLDQMKKVGSHAYDRPPKYMLDPSEYKKFGY